MEVMEQALRNINFIRFNIVEVSFVATIIRNTTITPSGV